MDQCCFDKSIAKTVSAVRRIGDDVFRQRLVGLQEIQLPVTIAAINQVRRNDAVTSLDQLIRDSAVATSRFPNITGELFDG